MKGIERRMREFRELPDVTALGNVSSRIMDVVSLIYTAGLLAQKYEVLPDEIDCEAAAVHCLRLHLGLRVESDPVQQLLGWASTYELHDLRDGRRSSLSDAAMRERGAFIVECKGVTQLCIAPQLFRQSFPKSKPMLKILSKRQILKVEGKGDSVHQTTHAPVRTDGRNVRMYVFIIPEFAEWLKKAGYPLAPKRLRKR